MKKSVELSLARNSFLLEEDAYLYLRNYLQQFKERLGLESASEEIMEDIEERIAELLNGQLKMPRQVVHIEMIKEIVAQLGFPDGSTFIPHDEHIHSGATDSEYSQAFNQSRYSSHDNMSDDPHSGRFYRDMKNAKLGGVCAGVSRYMKWDIAVVRILVLSLMALAIFGAPIFPLGTAIFIAYFIVWVATPSTPIGNEMNSTIGSNFSNKRIYRDRQIKKIAGVCAGLSYYLNIDVVLVRVLFLISFFFGIGLITYIIIWIAAPYALTAKQKCEMYGVPVTAENLKKYF